MFTVVWAALAMAFAGVALAAVINCTGGRCDGTNSPDQITGSPLRDRIFALAGADQVEARAGDDELNGGDGGDDLFGETENDTYFGGRGDDILRETLIIEPTPPIVLSNDEMNGGANRDFIEGNEGNDILRGQEDNDSQSGAFFPSMFGGGGDDELYGGLDDDGLQGEAGTDKHFGGKGNDYIDAVSADSVGTPDLVNCGSGIDTARVREPEDIVRANCEEVREVV